MLQSGSREENAYEVLKCTPFWPLEASRVIWHLLLGYSDAH